MFYKIEVKDKPGIFDAVGAGIKKDILDLGVKGIEDVGFVQVYIIEGDIREEAVKKICSELLIDPVAQDFTVNARNEQRKGSGEFVVEIAHNPGVMDPVEESALKGINDLGISGVTAFKTAKKYILKGKISSEQLKIISEKLLYNKLIQHIVQSEVRHCEEDVFGGRRSNPKNEIASAPACGGAHRNDKINYQFNLIHVDLLSANDKQLMQISKQGQLFLNLHEMRQIQKYFQKIKRNPTDAELETVAQTWSEHCYHKTFRGKIEYREKIKNK